MAHEAFEHIQDDRHVWDEFERKFAFTPYYRPAGPAIDEPPGSVTVDLSPIFDAGGSAEFDTGAKQVDQLVLESFQRVFDDTTRLLVLDWQHASYWFRPHAIADATRWPPSPVTPFPNGDYYIFLTADMSQGTFGHPWEQTLCVFGNDLVDDLVPTLPFPIRRRQPRIVSITSGERPGADSETE
ncbi:DUF2716 domain-containing protein [Lentzea sp. NPDC004789]